jgi:Lrp/AsnC family leucine-responsive transcriptional regulator
MQKKTLDGMDIEILRRLLDDSKQTYSELSAKLTVHKDTVRKRIKNLLTHGVIERFTININQQKLVDLYPSLFSVIFAVNVLRESDALVRDLLEHQNVIEVNETTPAAVHDILVHTEFRDINQLSEFTKWLKLKENVDPTRLDVMPIFKQYRRRQRIATVLAS